MEAEDIIDNGEHKQSVFNILIVDDDKFVLKALYMTLRRAKQFKSNISAVYDVEEALQKLHDQDFDLVISDFSMPKMDGVRFLNEVKKIIPRAARMLITGYTDIEMAKRVIDETKVDIYFEKPWNNEELRATIFKVLKKKEGK